MNSHKKYWLTTATDWQNMACTNEHYSYGEHECNDDIADKVILYLWYATLIQNEFNNAKCIAYHISMHWQHTEIVLTKLLTQGLHAILYAKLKHSFLYKRLCI